MSCLPCFRGKRKDDSSSEDEKEVIHVGMTVSIHKKPDNGVQSKPAVKPTGNIQSQTFTFRELAAATNNFSPDCLLGEGGFGRVYQGHLQSGSQVVAIKKLDRNSLQGNREFLVEVLMLSLLHHPNLVNLVGYCADGDQRLLVYEFMPKGCLEDHLLDLESSKQPLNWYARMRIAYGAAQGLEYLHDRANPPVIYRDFKPSNILLDEDLHPKLSDFGLAKLGPYGDMPIASSRVMGTYGYCAPEYARTGQISQKSDVYSFGVVLLELITGRRVIDTTKPTNEENLLTWAQPMFKEQKRYPELVDPRIRGDFPVKGLNQAVAIAAMCIQEEASVRPLMADVVLTLSFLIDGPTFRPISACPEPSPYATPSEFPTTAHSAKSSSDSDFLVDDNTSHVVETLQLGLKSRKSRRSQESISCSNSRNSSPRSGSEGSSRSRSDDGSSSSKHSEVSSKHGSDEGSNSGKSDYESD